MPDEKNNKAKSTEEKKHTVREELLIMQSAYKKMEEKCNNALSLAREYKADMDRMKQRAKDIEKEKTKQVAEAAVLGFLPVLDNLEIALSSCRDPQVAKGFGLIKSQFEEVIAKTGAEKVVVEGQFNPQVHECISTIPAAKPEQANQIAHVLKNGYIMYGKVIRPASVVIYN